MSYGVRKGSDSGRKASDGVRKVSYGAKKVLRRCHMVSERSREGASWFPICVKISLEDVR